MTRKRKEATRRALNDSKTVAIRKTIDLRFRNRLRLAITSARHFKLVSVKTIVIAIVFRTKYLKTARDNVSLNISTFYSSRNNSALLISKKVCSRVALCTYVFENKFTFSRPKHPGGLRQYNRSTINNCENSTWSNWKYF